MTNKNLFFLGCRFSLAGESYLRVISYVRTNGLNSFIHFVTKRWELGSVQFKL